MADRQYPPTPELDKMQEHREEAQCIGAFIEWLREEQHVGFFRVKVEEDGVTTGVSYTPFCEDINTLLAHYFNIDMKKVEEERQQILAYIAVKHGDKPDPKFSMKAEGEELGDTGWAD